MDTATAATRRVDLIKPGSEYAFDTRDADAPDHSALLIPGGRNQTRNVMRMKHAFAAYQKNTDTFFGHECITSEGDDAVMSVAELTSVEEQRTLNKFVIITIMGQNGSTESLRGFKRSRLTFNVATVERPVSPSGKYLYLPYLVRPTLPTPRTEITGIESNCRATEYRLSIMDLVRLKWHDATADELRCIVGLNIVVTPATGPGKLAGIGPEFQHALRGTRNNEAWTLALALRADLFRSGLVQSGGRDASFFGSGHVFECIVRYYYNQLLLTVKGFPLLK
ncbi:hypothetical protein EV424DRAFT_1565021 [Suillus variegatus]|nr:hypothetical protein EV424DRAFT_1565021 [Suillus variegatus]